MHSYPHINVKAVNNHEKTFILKLKLFSTALEKYVRRLGINK